MKITHLYVTSSELILRPLIKVMQHRAKQARGKVTTKKWVLILSDAKGAPLQDAEGFPYKIHQGDEVPITYGGCLVNWLG